MNSLNASKALPESLLNESKLIELNNTNKNDPNNAVISYY